MILAPGDIGNVHGGYEVVNTSDWYAWFEDENATGPLDCDRSVRETQEEAEVRVAGLIAHGWDHLPPWDQDYESPDYRD